MRRLLFTVLIFLGSTPLAWSEIELPYTFQNGSLADADQVNANFNAIATEFNLPFRYLDEVYIGGDEDTRVAWLRIDSYGNGQFTTYHNEGHGLVDLSYTTTDCGYLSTGHPNGNKLIILSTSSDNQGGFLRINNPDETRCASLFANSSGGNLYIYDSSGNEVASITAEGEITGTTKSFVAAHPEDLQKKIVYTSLEGPEAAMYARGSASLENGHAVVSLPDHFKLLASPDDMTVTLTPHSADSLGLARISLTPDHLEVKELLGGIGNYEFDYMVYAVRKGYEHYQVIRNASD
jgi:hypothetical protein